MPDTNRLLFFEPPEDDQYLEIPWSVSRKNFLGLTDAAHGGMFSPTAPNFQPNSCWKSLQSPAEACLMLSLPSKEIGVYKAVLGVAESWLQPYHWNLHQEWRSLGWGETVTLCFL